MRRRWTLQRASGIGTTAGLLALLLWPFKGLYGDAGLWLFASVAALAGLCGFSILAMTINDIATRPRRGSRIRPLRSFDTILGATLLLLSWFEIHDAIGLLPA